MRSRVMSFAATLIAAVTAMLWIPAADALADAPTQPPSAHAYGDGHHATSARASTTSDRGPPAAHDSHAAYNAVDRWSHGAAARPDRPTPSPIITYDLPALLVQGAAVVTATLEATPDSSGLLSPFQRSDVAANAGPRALPIGPWGQRVVDARGKLPSSWGPGIPNSKKVGTKWFDPAAPKTNGVRIDQGAPGSSFPSQQVDHVIVRSGGNVLGPDGLPITGSIKQNPQAHIPLDDWLTWTSWNAP